MRNLDSIFHQYVYSYINSFICRFKKYPDNPARSHYSNFDIKTPKGKIFLPFHCAVTSDRILLVKERSETKRGATYEIVDSFSTDLVVKVEKNKHDRLFILLFLFYKFYNLTRFYF